MQYTENYNLKKPEAEEFYNVQDFNDNMDILDEKVQECFQSVSSGKQLVASAITDKGITTASDATFATMAENINNISTGVDTSSDTIVEDALLEGYTAHNANQEQIIGTLPDKTSTANHVATANLDNTNGRLKMKIPALGRYGTSNYLYVAYSAIASLIGLTAAKLVKGNTILGITGNNNNIDTSSADAAASDIVSGKKAGVDGKIITGILPDASGSTVEASAISQDDTYTYLDIPTTARYDTSSKIKTLNSNLTSNINMTHNTYGTQQNGTIPGSITIKKPNNFKSAVCTLIVYTDNDYRQINDVQYSIDGAVLIKEIKGDRYATYHDQTYRVYRVTGDIVSIFYSCVYNGHGLAYLLIDKEFTDMSIINEPIVYTEENNKGLYVYCGLSDNRGYTFINHGSHDYICHLHTLNDKKLVATYCTLIFIVYSLLKNGEVTFNKVTGGEQSGVTLLLK